MMIPVIIPAIMNQTLAFPDKKVLFLFFLNFIYPVRIQLKLVKVNCLSDFKVKERLHFSVKK
jgi:hypothetical protein